MINHNTQEAFDALYESLLLLKKTNLNTTVLSIRSKQTQVKGDTYKYI